MVRGVCLTLEPDTKIPTWIEGRNLNVKVETKRHAVSGRALLRLRIKRGEALFCPGGGVDVKMPGSREFRPAFEPRKVLEIADFKGNVKRNHFLCLKCGTLTGEVVSEKRSATAGKSDVVVKCTKCKFEWVVLGF